MWRSLFLAIGIYSILLGAQTLVVDQFETAAPRELPGANGTDANQAAYNAPGYYNNGTNNAANSFARNQGDYNNQGAYNIDPAVNDNRYLTGLQRSPYQLTGYGNNGYGSSLNTGVNSGRNSLYNSGGGANQLGAVVQGAPGPSIRQRIIRTKDWMPWSLIAFGSVVVIYTTSFSRRGSE